MVENTTTSVLHTDSARRRDCSSAQPQPRESPIRRKKSRADYRQTVIDEMRRQIEARLRGDVHELSISGHR